jgi:hypothetical protein
MQTIQKAVIASKGSAPHREEESKRSPEYEVLLGTFDVLVRLASSFLYILRRI